jgi:hypothetical protein
MDEWSEKDRHALRPKNDPPHRCPRCKLVNIFWTYYPPLQGERYVNADIDGDMEYYGTLHTCFPCEWACGLTLWYRPATSRYPRAKVDVDGDHIKEHWCDNRRIVQDNITQRLREKLEEEAREAGLTYDEHLALKRKEIKIAMDYIKEQEAIRKSKMAQRDKEFVEAVASGSFMDKAIVEPSSPAYKRTDFVTLNIMNTALDEIMRQMVELQAKKVDVKRGVELEQKIKDLEDINSAFRSDVLTVIRAIKDAVDKFLRS